MVLFSDTHRNLWIWRETYGVKQITRSGDVLQGLISPDNALVIFLRDINQQVSLWTIRPDGQGETLLITEEIVSNLAPSVLESTFLIDLQWVPGTNLLAFSTGHNENQKTVFHGDIWILNIDTGQLRLLFQASEGFRYKISPDGSKIILISPTSISMVDINGSNFLENIFSYQAVNTYLNTDYYPLPYWSPDNHFLYIILPPRDSLSIPIQETIIWRIPFDGSQPSIQKSIITSPLILPEISPDASSIIYQAPISNDPGISITELHIASLDGTSDEVYFTDQINFLGWAPDSEAFIFNTGQGSLDTVFASRSMPPVSIPGSRGSLQVYWLTPQQFVYITQQGSQFELRSCNTELTGSLLTTIPGSGSYEPTIWPKSP